MPDRRPALLLIDGSSLVYRAYFGMLRGGRGRSSFRTRDGRPTGAVFGMLMTLRKLLAEYAPESIAVAFDSREPTFRHEAFAGYKANREAMPEDLALQLPAVERAIEAMRIPCLRAPGYEADDLIGTATARAVARGYDVTIVTGDKDLYQLLGDHVDMLRVRGSDVRRITAPEVPDVFGVRADQVIDVLALWGDTSDNIPGVRGIGEKRAIELVRAHGDLAGVYGSLATIRPAIAELLRAGETAARMSYDLATVVTDLDLDLDPECWRQQEPDLDALIALCRDHEFHRLATELARDQPAPVLRLQTATITTLHALLGDHGSSIGVEIPTAAGDSLHLGLASTDHILVCDLGALQVATSAALSALLNSPDVPRHSFDRKGTRRALHSVGLELSGPGDDISLMAYLLDPGRPIEPQALASELLGRAARPTTPASAAPDARQGNLFADSSARPAAADHAAAERAELTLALHPILRSKLHERGLLPLYRDLELPLGDVLLRMEERGIRLDVAAMTELARECRERRELLESEAHALAGGAFNLASPQQVGEVLFERMALAAGRRTRKSGVASTDTEVLAELAREHELPRKILEHRELSKLIGAYLETLPASVNPTSGRVHTTFQQTVTATGRLSSSDPNLQNIPARTELGRRIRAAFVAETGRQLVIADYSQIELRLLAHLSGDDALVAAFRDGADVHQRTAAQMFDVAPDLVTPELRRRAKVLNFGIIYGMSAHGLARELHIAPGEARRLIDDYFAGYHGVRAWLDTTLEEARRTAEVRTMFGRVRSIPQIHSSHRAEREYAERIAVNTPIQGAAADLMKMAMLAVDRELVRLPRSHMLLQVHDELVVECRDEDVAEVRCILEQAMSEAVALSIPVTVNVGAGSNWRDAK